MHKITIYNLDNRIVESNDQDQTILATLQENYIDWMHACGGKGRCTTCKATVTEGIENLSAATDAEERFVNQNKLDASRERLMCQTKLVTGHVGICVPDESKLPHINYT